MSDITLRRVGAIGDAIWATALFDALSSRAINQGGKLYFSTSAPRELFIRDARLGGVLGKDSVCGELIDLTDVYEKSPTVHPIQAYAEHAGCEWNAPRVKVGRVESSGLVIIHPAISWANRTFPVDFWQTVINKLTQAGQRVGIVGTAVEAQPYTGCVKFNGNMIDTARKILAGKVFIGSDSGPLQIAAAVGAPAIGLYTCAESRLRAPMGHTAPFTVMDTAAHCRGCLHRAPAPVRFHDCDYTDERKHQCVNMIDPQSVVDAALRLI